MKSVSIQISGIASSKNLILVVCVIALFVGAVASDVMEQVPTWTKYMNLPRGVTKRIATDSYKTNDTVDANKLELVPVTIGDTSLNIFAGYITSLGPWSKEKRSYVDYLGLAFDMRDFLPHAHSRIDDLESTVSVSPNEDLVNYRNKEHTIHRAVRLDHDGLQGWIQETNILYPEFYTASLPSGERVSFACLNPSHTFPNPLCRNFIHLNGALWTYQFSRSKLAQWGKIHVNTLATIQSFYAPNRRK